MLRSEPVNTPFFLFVADAREGEFCKAFRVLEGFAGKVRVL